MKKKCNLLKVTELLSGKAKLTVKQDITFHLSLYFQRHH